jgi:hypothetical protein
LANNGLPNNETNYNRIKESLAVILIIYHLNLNTVLRIHIFKSQFFFISIRSLFFIFCICSEVLPAVLDSEMSVDVLKWSVVLVGVLIDQNLSPLDGVLGVWELGTPILLVLESSSGAIIPPLGMLRGEGWMSVSINVGGPVAKSKSAELDAKLPFVSEILDDSSVLNVVILLMLVLLDPFIKVAWHSWEVVESWLVDSILILAGDDQWGTLLLGGIGVEVHASAWLHSSGNWLLLVFGELWNSVAFNNLDVEVNIGVEWDWLATNWSPGEGTTVDKVGWAVKMSLGTLMELSESKIPTVEDFSSTEREGLWSASWLLVGVSDDSAILKSSNPVNGNPVTWLALWSGTWLSDINTNSRQVIGSSIVLVVLTIWTIYIWLNLG